jgi:tricorn protease interacting factor F2/3
MEDVSPINYRIMLEPDLERFSFLGKTEILAEAAEPITQVTLDAVELTILTCGIEQKDGLLACAFHVDPTTETLRISLPKTTVGRFLIKIEHRGSINDKMAGFYRSRFTKGGESSYIAVTQFQERDARRAFPCFDHPLKKATFDLEMQVDHDLVAISNGPVLEEKDRGNGKKLVKFAQTPKMSTYLLFFGLGEFEFTEDMRDVVLRVVTVPGKKEYARFGLEFVRKALEFCEDYFAVAYPLPKLDLIAVPDFAFGAMENWGAITFRENLLLHYPHITSRPDEERICEVIAHEIAHQWFGNLVTPSDWKYLWLNESFATFFAYGVVNHHQPEWEIWDQFLRTQTGQALERDALHETSPIELPEGGGVAITAGTAPIIYNKGGSILRQLEGYIGAENLKEGVRNYLNAHQYGCAASHHLWEAFETVSKEPITHMMQTWVEQPGFPLVEVESRGADLVLTQQRFTYLPNASPQTWSIPIRIRIFFGSGDERSITTRLENTQKTVEIGSDVLAYKINDGQVGFYRVKYRDSDVLSRLGQSVLNKELASEDRWGLQNDLYALVRQTEVSIDAYLDFLLNYKNEDAYLPLTSIADNLLHAFLVVGERRREKIVSIARPLTERVLSTIGFEPQPDEKHTLSILRDQLIWHAALYGSETVERFSQDKFASLVAGEPLHADLMRSTLRVGAFRAREKDFSWFDRTLQSADSEHVRMHVLVAFGCFRDGSVIRKAQDYILQHVPNRNKFIPVLSMASNPYAIPSLWDWYVSHLDELEQFHPAHYERVVEGIVPIAGIGKEDEVRTFFNDYMGKKDKARDVIKLSLERLEINSRMHAL